MRSLALAVFLLSSMAPRLQAGGLEKAYFGATHPGTWARHQSSWEMPDGKAGTNVYTHIRVSDSDGRVRLEVDTETLAGPGEGMVSRQLFIMEPGFELARNFLSRMMFLEASVAQSGDGEPSLMPDEVIRIMRQSAGDLTNSVTFKGRAEREGKECDHYSYSYESGGPHATLQEGEICLNETVPFGIVFQKGRVKDATGALLSSFEETLLDSGSGESAAAALLAMTPKAPTVASEAVARRALPSMPLVDAYQNEKVDLLVEVQEGTGGRRLSLVVANKTSQSLDVVVPEGPLTIPAGSPLGVLELFVEELQRFALAPGGSSPAFVAGQLGERGATAGKFRLTVYEGQPLFQGSVEVGPLK